MPPYDPNYPNFREYPKWIGNVLVHCREEEREIATATAAVEAAAERMMRVTAEVEAPEAVPPEPEPARPPASTTMTRTCPPSSQGTASVRPPSSAMARMQRMRQRRRTGKRAIQFEISVTQIEGLVVAGFLDPAMQDDMVEVALGIGRMLDHVARYSVTPIQAPACYCSSTSGGSG